MSVTVQHRRDTAANFAETNRIFAQGERMYEIDTKKWKVADGVTAYNDLPYEPNGSGDMLSTNNLSDVASTTTARTNLDVYSKGEVDAAISNSNNGIRQRKVIAIADNTAAPPTEVSGDRYILDETGGGVHANWDGASANDIVEFDGTNWVATTPEEGFVTYVDADDKDAVFVDDGTPQWELRAVGSGSSAPEPKTGTSIVFTENAEYYADGSYNPNTSGDIVLDLTDGVIGTTVNVFASGYTPDISGEEYIILGDTSNGVRDIYSFYYAHDGIKLNIIGESILTTPVVTLTPDDEEIQVDWTTSVGATSYTVLRNTSDTTVGATTIYTGALLTYTDTGLTNGTDYYYFVQATGADGKHDSLYGTNTDQPEAYPSTAFVFNVKTDNAGASANDQFTVPTRSGGSYNCTVDWGDGNTDIITTWDDAAWTHTYASAGTYRIVITGTEFKSMRFANGGDKEKITILEQWGLFNPNNEISVFWGCVNLDIQATDAPDLTGVTTLNQFIRGCTSVTDIPNFHTWDTALIENWVSFANLASNYNQDLSDLDISGATTLSAMLANTSFNSPLPTSSTPNNTDLANFLANTPFNGDISVLDLSNGPKLQSLLDGASSFNHVSINSLDVGQCDDFDFMLRGTTSLDQSLSSWDTTNATSAVGFMDSTSISQSNYDATLIGWDTRTGYNSMNWDFNTCNYTAAGAGGTARTSLVGKGLTFTDVAN